jgi:hypothetical protein
LFVDAVLWLVRAGAPWRDLPEEFGKWNSVFRRFRRWAKKGAWKRLFAELGENPDLEYQIIDSTIVRAHQRAAGAMIAWCRGERHVWSLVGIPSIDEEDAPARLRDRTRAPKGLPWCRSR